MTPQPAMSLSPSATLGQKTLWAQIGQFPNTQAALAFWDQYRQAHPDFPVVRVRVTSPYSEQLRGNDQVWLRVGPFARQAFISNLCASVPHPDANSNQPGLSCGTITDLGIASAPNRMPGYLPASRYSR
jgi:hypothetical protein